MAKRSTLVGEKYNKLLVISFCEMRKNSSYWNVQCDCGNVATIEGKKLRNGHTKSCGCLKKENSGFQKGHKSYQTDESRKKIGLFHKGKIVSEETRKKISKALKGNKGLIGNANVLKKWREKNGVWNKGLKGFLGGEKHWKWQGDKVGYYALHIWVRKILGKAKKCSKCGKEKGMIHWANKDHKYKRDANHFIEFCPTCHGEYDKKNNLRKHAKKRLVELEFAKKNNF